MAKPGVTTVVESCTDATVSYRSDSSLSLTQREFHNARRTHAMQLKDERIAALASEVETLQARVVLLTALVNDAFRHKPGPTLSGEAQTDVSLSDPDALCQVVWTDGSSLWQRTGLPAELDGEAHTGFELGPDSESPEKPAQLGDEIRTAEGLVCDDEKFHSRANGPLFGERPMPYLANMLQPRQRPFLLFFNLGMGKRPLEKPSVNHSGVCLLKSLHYTASLTFALVTIWGQTRV